MNFYREAGVILDKLDSRKGTIKGLCLQDKVRDKKKMYAIICQTLKAKELLNDILSKASFWEKEKKSRLSRNLVLVLTYDLLFRQRGIQAPSGPIKSIILGHKTRLKAELAKARIQKGALANSDLIEKPDQNQAPIPRYIRVNTIKVSADQVIKILEKEGYKRTSFSEINWGDKKARWVASDDHVENLLLLPPGTDLHAHALVSSGKIILQDKASCFPAFALSPPSGSHVIDACAAPGNKTSHLAMLMKNRGKVWGLDLDPRRLNTLKSLTTRAGASIIEPRVANFLELDPELPEFQRVEYLLLDPSCSGSGIVSRLDYLIDNEESVPKVRQIVYSTCSIHQDENESVVARVLESHGTDWKLKHIIPSWPRRGITTPGLNHEQTQCLVRCDPKLDSTNGFFVALFEKINQDPPLQMEEDKTYKQGNLDLSSCSDIKGKRSSTHQEPKTFPKKKQITSKRLKIHRSVTSI